MISHPLEPDAATLDAWTAECAAFVRAHVLSLAEQPSFDVDGAEALAATFREPPPGAGRPLAELLARLAPAVAKSFNTAGPGYLAFIPGGGILSAAVDGIKVAEAVATSIIGTRAAAA